MLLAMTGNPRSSETPDEKPGPGSNSDAPAPGSAQSLSDHPDPDPGLEAGSRRPRRGPPPNPLYHPLFLPVLLVGYSLWFGYDGFLSPPDYEHRFFNQVMFGVTAVIALWVVPRGVREFQRDREAAARKQEPTQGPRSRAE